jgi:hypothetical protein
METEGSFPHSQVHATCPYPGKFITILQIGDIYYYGTYVFGV